MILTITDRITEDIVKQVASFFNEGDKDTQYTIYICSGGGMNSMAGAIINMINDHKDRTELIAYGEICSNAMQIFFKSRCKRKILPFTVGMYHLYYQKIDYYEGDAKRNNDHATFTRSTSSFVYSESLDNLVNFTGEELKRIKNNEDVWFTTERLEEMLTFNLTQI